MIPTGRPGRVDAELLPSILATGAGAVFLVGLFATGPVRVVAMSMAGALGFCAVELSSWARDRSVDRPVRGRRDRAHLLLVAKTAVGSVVVSVAVIVAGSDLSGGGAPVLAAGGVAAGLVAAGAAVLLRRS